MRKRNEGYALVLVLVTLVVLSILSGAVMSIGLTNLKSQNASQKRMEDKYLAQGKVEKVIAVLSEEGSLEVEKDKDPKDPIETWFKAIPEVTAVSGNMNVTVAVDAVAEDGLKTGTYSGTVILSVSEDTMQIQCELAFSGKFAQKDTLSNPSVYDITPEKVEYLRYDISRISEGGAEG